MQGPGEDEDIAEKGRKARREFDAGRAAIPRDKVVQRPAVTKLWVNGRGSEDRDEWRKMLLQQNGDARSTSRKDSLPEKSWR